MEHRHDSNAGLMQELFDDPELLAEFVVEARELVADAVTKVDRNRLDGRSAQRLFHTIKGLSGSFGLLGLATVSSRCEKLATKLSDDVIQRGSKVYGIIKALLWRYEDHLKGDLKADTIESDNAIGRLLAEWQAVVKESA